jgi:hypothetical protein
MGRKSNSAKAMSLKMANARSHKGETAATEVDHESDDESSLEEDELVLGDDEEFDAQNIRRFFKLEAANQDYSSDEEDATEEEEDLTETRMLGLLQQRVDERTPGGATIYKGDSRTTLYRGKKKQQSLAEAAKGSGNILDYFSSGAKPVAPLVEEEMDTDQEEEPREQKSCKPSWGDKERLEAIDALKGESFETPNARKEKKSKLSKYNHTRMLAVRSYLVLLGSMGKMDASSLVAQTLYNKTTEPELKGKSYTATAIRVWGDFFVMHKSLPEYKRGQSKNSIIHDEDVQTRLRLELRELGKKDKYRSGVSPDALIQIVRDTYEQRIGKTTVTLWLHLLGWNFRTGVGLFFDGHERSDVVVYRKLFVERWKEREQFIGVYDEDTASWTYPFPARRVVMITHDECITRANDAEKKMWFGKDQNRMTKKHVGQSYMISGFVCPCHGMLHKHFLSPGKNNEGWWTNALLVEQLVPAMRAAEILHPDCELVFLFDNSANHHAVEPTGLNIAAFSLNGNGKNFPKGMKDGFFMQNGVKVTQSMYKVKLDGTKSEKGLRAVLEERGLWMPKMKMEAAATLLKSQPDFAAQGSWLEETVKTAGHVIDFYPKYHCELSCIEKVWSFLKCGLRKNCDYTFESLKVNVPTLLDAIPLPFFAKAARSCSRYVMAYGCFAGEYLSFEQVRYAHKKFTSHRKIKEDPEVLKGVLSLGI